MCLSKPHKVLDYSDGFAIIEFLGKRKKVKSPVVLKKDDWVLCQANTVARKLPASEAVKMLREWKLLNEWK